MSARRLAAAFALGFLCSVLVWAVSRPSEEALEPPRGETAPARTEAGVPERAPVLALPEEGTPRAAPSPTSAPVESSVASAPIVPVTTPRQKPTEQPPTVSPGVLPRTKTSWLVPLELGWRGATSEQPIPSTIGFRPVRLHPNDTPFTARIQDARGGVFTADLPVRGLIPLELADGREAYAQGDELLVARAPVLLRLPELPFPVRVDLLRPDGQLSATLLLDLVEGEVRAEVH